MTAGQCTGRGGRRRCLAPLPPRGSGVEVARPLGGQGPHPCPLRGREGWCWPCWRERGDVERGPLEGKGTCERKVVERHIPGKEGKKPKKIKAGRKPKGRSDWLWPGSSSRLERLVGLGYWCRKPYSPRGREHTDTGWGCGGFAHSFCS